VARRIPLSPQTDLAEYEQYARLAPAVGDLRAEARQVAPLLEGRTVWMVNSTPQGGGVAEMLPALVWLLRDLGVSTEWAVIETEDPDFFAVTKRLHNLIHGVGDPELTVAEREVFEAVNRRNAEEMAGWMRPGDVLVVHDPQPMPLAGMLVERVPLHSLWRCHIGLDEQTPQTRAAWRFLRPHAEPYDHAIFSAPEYIPDYLASRSTVLYPALDPLTNKNRELSVHDIVHVLANGALTAEPGPMLTPCYPQVAERLQPDGTFAPVSHGENIGLLHRPTVTQISRWDRLKGWVQLMRAFALLKRRLPGVPGLEPLERRRLELARLALAGPDPASVADDPEGREVLEELTAEYRALPAEAQRDVALLALPMRSRIENALMVNALQRTSSVVVQNSLREGFGLTVTEAMWKGIPVLSNRRAVGPRQQLRDGVDGVLVDDPRDVEALAEALERMLSAPEQRQAWGRSAQRRAQDQFLVFRQLEGWLRLLGETVRSRPGATRGARAAVG
jgi:trehalose synthase